MVHKAPRAQRARFPKYVIAAPAGEPAARPSCQARIADDEVYLLSLGAGLLVGVVYSLLNVRSPAPPVVALVGLLGILVGEQIIPVGQAS